MAGKVEKIIRKPKGKRVNIEEPDKSLLLQNIGGEYHNKHIEITVQDTMIREPEIGEKNHRKLVEVFITKREDVDNKYYLFEYNSKEGLYGYEKEIVIGKEIEDTDEFILEDENEPECEWSDFVENIYWYIIPTASAKIVSQIIPKLIKEL